MYVTVWLLSERKKLFSLCVKSYRESINQLTNSPELCVFDIRYADRAKKIKNKAVVNENPMDKLIRELREENDRLKKMIEGGGMPADTSGRELSEYLPRFRVLKHRKLRL